MEHAEEKIMLAAADMAGILYVLCAMKLSSCAAHPSALSLLSCR